MTEDAEKNPVQYAKMLEFIIIDQLREMKGMSDELERLNVEVLNLRKQRLDDIDRVYFLTGEKCAAVGGVKVLYPRASDEVETWVGHLFREDLKELARELVGAGRWEWVGEPQYWARRVS